MKERLSKISQKAMLLSAAALSAMVTIPQVANAQENTTAEEETPRQMNTIMVTTRARAESIQDVPLSITALDEDALDAKSIGSLEDVARFTSGFSFENFSGGFATPVIRGQAQTRVTALESNVSTFFDGIYMPRSWATDVGTSSIARIEVVKGPQSARYGRNAFAGAINYVPRKAELGLDAPTGNIFTTIGDDERFDVGMTGIVPIGERFAMGASIIHSEYDGSWENSHPFADAGISPGTTGNSGGWDNESVSFTAIAEPIDGWVTEFGYYNFTISREMGANNQFAESAFQMNCGATRNFQESLLCGELPGPTDSVAIDPRAYSVQSDTDIFRFRTAYDLTNDLELSYMFGRVEGEVDIANMTVPDQTNCAGLCTFQNAPIGAIAYDSHELKLDYTGDSFRGALGAFYTDGTDDYLFEYVLVPNLTAGSTFSLGEDPSAIRFPLTDSTTETEVTSFFAEGQYTLPGGSTRVGAEVRWSETTLTATNNASGLQLEETFTAVTPRFTVEHDLTDYSLVYASAARGAKAGGFNPTAVAPEFQVFDEEFNWTYELGAKNTFMDGRLVLNGALFYTDWTDVQINSPDPSSADPDAVSITLNLGNAEVLGVEFDAAFYATDNLSFDGTFSHADGTYSDGTIDARFRRTPSPCDNVVCSTDGDVSGNDIERTPQTQASFGAQWEDTLPMWGGPTWSVRGDLTWQSEFYAESANLATIPERTLLGARAGLDWDNVNISLWAKNLTDESYVSNAYVVLIPFGNTYQTFYGPRRSFGMTARYSF